MPWLAGLPTDYRIETKLIQRMLDIGLEEQDARYIFRWTAKGRLKPADTKQKATLLALRRLHVLLPKKLQAIPKIVYRGVKIPNKQYRLMLEGKTLKFEPRIIQSWTASRSVAKHYTESGYGFAGLVLISPVGNKGVIYFGNDLVRYLGLYGTAKVQHEVIVLGNLIPSISMNQKIRLGYFGPKSALEA